MLDATKDGNDERPTLSRREGSPKAITMDVGNRMVYKLVKVGDDGSVLAATEDEVFRSLIGEPNDGLSPLDPDINDVIEDDKDKEGSDDLVLDGDDLSVRADITPIQDLAVERQKLKAQIEVLDHILMRVDIEEQRRLYVKKEVVECIGCHEGNCSTNLNASEGSGDFKRQRRPNPKYFNYDGGDDSLMGPSLSSSSKEPMTISISLQKPRRSPIIVSPRVTSGWGSHRMSRRAVASYKARIALSPKPFIPRLNKVASTCSSGLTMSTISKEGEFSLDNLSIRELHEAFCSTYGRETFVKDKHWLKRQISTGWMMRQQDVVVRSCSQQHVQYKLKARLDRITEAQQPFPTTTLVNAGEVDRDVANEAHIQRASEVEHFRDAFRNRLGNTYFQRRVTTPKALSRDDSFGILTTRSLNGSSVAVGQTIYRKVVNNGEVVEGKRQRKPNRRYIEDEVHRASEFVPVHHTRSFYGEANCDGLNSTTNYSWRNVETDGLSDMIGRHGAVRRSTLRNVSSKKFSPIQRPKFLSIGMKQKIGSKTGKLAKITHPTARVARQDAKVFIRKAKFWLPTTPNVEMNGIPEMNGGFEEQESNLMHVVPFDPSAVLQPLVLHSRGESEQPIVTIPTANGGTRRKHHRPWTLREVMKLVEGVARCGGGKWADIKKLAFSTIGYRTAVDLKDKWRNLLRASRAQLHPAKQGERKKQLTAAIPAPILARVRELASLPKQIPSSTVSSSSTTSRSGRIVHRK